MDSLSSAIACREGMNDNFVVPVEERYRTAAYSHFVESPRNTTLYNDYYHYYFFELFDSLLMQRSAVGEEKDCNDSGAGHGEDVVSILDMGCGNSVLGRKLLRRRHQQEDDQQEEQTRYNQTKTMQITGIDLSEAMIEESRRLCQKEGCSNNFKFMRGNSTSLPDDIGVFDFIISGFVLIHMFSKEMLFQFFHQVSKHLKNGGSTLHIVPCVFGDYENDDDSVPAVDGAIQTVELPISYEDQDGEQTFLELDDVYWKKETYQLAVTQAGLIDFKLQRAKLAPNSELDPNSLPSNLYILTARKR